MRNFILNSNNVHLKIKQRRAAFFLIFLLGLISDIEGKIFQYILCEKERN